MSINKQSLRVFLVMVVFVIHGSASAISGEIINLFEDSLVGTDIHVEKIKSIKSSGYTYILYKKSNRITRDSSYVFLALDLDGKTKSLDIDVLSGNKKIQLGNISFTKNGNLVLSLVINDEINLLIFADDFGSYKTEKVFEDGKVDIAYYFNNKIYAFSSVNNTVELATYNYIAGSAFDSKSKNTIQIDSALTVEDAIFLDDEKIYLLANFVLDKSIGKKIVVIEKEKISYIDIDSQAVEIIGIDGKEKLLYISVVDGTKRRVKSYSALEISTSVNKVVNKYLGGPGLRWVDMGLYGEKKLISLEVEKNKWTKKFKLYCRDMIGERREQLDIDAKGILRFYNEAFLLKKAASDFYVALVYSELRGRVTRDVFSVIKIEKKICK